MRREKRCRKCSCGKALRWYNKIGLCTGCYNREYTKIYKRKKK